jgi:zinc transport system substrate-binding protein
LLRLRNRGKAAQIVLWHNADADQDTGRTHHAALTAAASALAVGLALAPAPALAQRRTSADEAEAHDHVHDHDRATDQDQAQDAIYRGYFEDEQIEERTLADWEGG